MTERQLLEKGIRAIGVYFLMVGLSAAIAMVLRSLFTGPQIVLVANASSSILTPIVAVLLFRFAGRIAGLVAEEPSDQDSRLSTSDAWERWLLATIVALAVLTSWARDFVQMMVLSIYSTALSPSDPVGPMLVVIMSMVSLSALSAIGFAVIRRPALLSGRVRHAD